MIIILIIFTATFYSSLFQVANKESYSLGQLFAIFFNKLQLFFYENTVVYLYFKSSRSNIIKCTIPTTVSKKVIVAAVF